MFANKAEPIKLCPAVLVVPQAVRQKQQTLIERDPAYGFLPCLIVNKNGDKVSVICVTAGCSYYLLGMGSQFVH